MIPDTQHDYRSGGAFPTVFLIFAATIAVTLLSALFIGWGGSKGQSGQWTIISRSLCCDMECRRVAYYGSYVTCEQDSGVTIVMPESNVLFVKNDDAEFQPPPALRPSGSTPEAMSDPQSK